MGTGEITVEEFGRVPGVDLAVQDDLGLVLVALLDVHLKDLALRHQPLRHDQVSAHNWPTLPSSAATHHNSVRGSELHRTTSAGYKNCKK